MAMGEKSVWDDPWLMVFVGIICFGIVFGVSTLIWVAALGVMAQ